MSTAFVLLNSELGSESSIISEINDIFGQENNVEYEIQGVYGVYDIVLKISSDNPEIIRAIIANKIRKIGKIQSTLTMMVIEEQENL